MGLFKKFGSWGTQLWQAARQAIQPIAVALGFAERAEREVDVSALPGELRHVIRAEGLAERIADVAESEYIPLNLYQTAKIPWNRPYAYRVEITGTDVKTGEFGPQERVITTSEQVTIEEILRIAEARFCDIGWYEQMYIDSMRVVGAEVREGEW